jgi:SAM-dependent methyltransferase
MAIKQYRQRRTDENTWDEHFKKYTLENLVKSVNKDQEYLPLFLKYFSRSGKILEAGCGLGQYIYALNSRGYHITGIDYAESAIKYTKSLYPELNLCVGDVRMHPFLDESFDGYISIGVVEHYEEGPEKILREAYRILKPHGIICISTPYANPLRQFLTSVFHHHRHYPGDFFYQYLFTKRELLSYISLAKFKIRHIHYYGVISCLIKEFSFVKKLYERLRNKVRHKRKNLKYTSNSNSKELLRDIYFSPFQKFILFVDRLPWVRKLTGHVIVVIAEKY